MINTRKYIIKTCLIIGLLFFMALPLLSQQGSTGRKQFYNLVELTKLIQRAREAGFSEEELRNLEIIDAGRTINVTDYMNEILNRQKIADQKLKDFLGKRFLTVGDVYNEMVKLEPNILIKLREELVSER